MTNTIARSFCALIMCLALACGERPRAVAPPTVKDNLWVFILAGQSNMAGRGTVEPEDTVTSTRIWTVDEAGKLIPAREPLNRYEPGRQGLGCGLSFGRALTAELPDSVSVLLLPAAIGGSSVVQWLNDSTHRGVKLLSNFREKAELGLRYGTIRAVLWHQGESDANKDRYPGYRERISKLFTIFRTTAMNDSLPILAGEIGTFRHNHEYAKLINEEIRTYTLGDPNAAVISAEGFSHKGDSLHFDSQSQRLMGRRFAETFLKHHRR